MLNQFNSNARNQKLIDYFNSRNDYEQECNFHLKLAQKLTELVQPKHGDKVLDIATGTGLVAFEFALKVGNQGLVIGVDFSEGMLFQAEQKLRNFPFNNLEFKLENIENLSFSECYFDLVLCCSALHYFCKIELLLKQWFSWIKVGGSIGLCVFGENSFIVGKVFRKVMRKYQIFLPKWNQETGTENQCRQILQQAGFENIRIKSEQFGSYLSLEQCQKQWDSFCLQNPLVNQFLPQDQFTLNQIKQDYLEEFKNLETDQGIWNDITVFFVVGDRQ
jgi:ubiquinone/menaquinone biosynthesis C-methylase UbiE